MPPQRLLPSRSAAPPGSQLLVADGTAWLCRSHFGAPSVSKQASAAAPLRAPSGQNTSALHIFLGTVCALLNAVPRASHVAVVFDFAAKNFRHELYPDYKAHRPPTPPQLAEAAPEARALLDLAGLSVLSVPGVEADDVVATLATRGAQVWFWSGVLGGVE